MTGPFDVAVIGAGPAGAAAAVRLASIGRSVLVVDRPGAVSDELWQHIPSRATALFEPLGLRAAVEAVAVRPDRAGELRWAGVASSMPGDGLLVDRRALRRVLADRLRRVGVHMVGGRATPPAPCDDTWAITAPRGGRIATAHVVIDASGHPPRWADRVATAPPTIALCLRWNRAPAPGLAVHALDRSWVWAAAGRTGGGGMTIQFADAHVGRAARAAVRESTLAQVSEAAASIGLEEPGELLVRSATAAYARRPAVDRLICVGDAASAVDPVTGHGLIGAIRSGLHGAAVANTMLDPDGDDLVARRFITERVAAAHLAHAARCGDLYARQAAVAPTRFWRRRAGVQPGREQRSWRVCLDSPVTWADDVRWRPTGVIVDDLVVERTALHHPALEAPIAFVAERPATLLQDWFGGGATVRDGVARAEAAGFGPNALNVAVELMRRGVLATVPRSVRHTTDRAATMSG